MKISLDSFRQVLLRSGLLTEAEVEREMKAAEAEVRAQRDAAAGEGGTATAVRPQLTLDARTLAQHLIAKDMLSVWQAEKLLAGKYKGFRLGKYKLIRLLGKGGMSSVYLAEHALMKRRVAIKVLPHKRVDDASYLGRFHREAQAVASLDHPNIVRAFDVDHETDGKMEIHFLVMEYVDGLSLQEVVAKRGPLPPREAADIIRQAALGLQHAHENNLVHRDIKPGNLLLDKSGTVRLLDLGLARFFDDSDENSLTVEHDEKVLGTADYLAPEQAVDSHSVDARADLYSLGCTLYFLLTGEPPFTQGTLAQRLIAHQSKQPPRLSEKRDDVPERLDAILLKLMAKKPENRPQSAAEASSLLADWLSEESPATAGGVEGPPAASDSFGAFLDHLDSGADLAPSAPDLSPGSGVGPMADSEVTGRGAARGRGRRAPEYSDTTPATGDPTPFPRGGRSSSNIHGRGSSSIVGRRKSSPPWGLIAGLATAAVIVAAGAIFFGGADTPPDGPQRPKETTNDGDAPAPATRPIVDGSVVVVGPGGNFGSLSEAVDHAASHFGKLTDGSGVIELVPGAVIPASVKLDSMDIVASLPKGMSIRTPAGQTPAVLVGNGTDPVLTLVGAEALTISNVVLDADGANAALELSGFLNRPVIEDFAIRGFVGEAVRVRDATSISGSSTTLRNGRIESTDPSGVGVTISGPAERVELNGVQLLGPMAAGVSIEGEAKQVRCIRCVFSECETGIKIDSPGSPVRNLRVIGNTFRQCRNPVRFTAMPGGQSAGFAFAQNLFAGGQVEVSVDGGVNRGEFDRMIRDGGWTGDNFTTRRQPKSPAKVEFRVVSDNGWSVNPDFASTEADSPDFLRPRADALKTAGGGPEPRFIGAVNPADD